MSEKLTILLLGKSNLSAAAIISALETQGYLVREAGTPAEAHALLDEAVADVVSLETTLTDGNTFDFGEENKALADMGWQSVNVGAKMSLVFDVLSNDVYINGMNIMLAPKEFSLLFLLARYKGKALSSEYLYEEVWKMPMLDESGVDEVKKQIGSLNKKLEESGNGRFALQPTEDGGYCFEGED
jgi:DNA-binding response OmpR family regulator